MEQSLIQRIILLGLIFPLLNVLLGEAVERLKSKNSALAIALRQIRLYVLPPLSMILVVRWLLTYFGVKGDETWLKILESLLWIASIVAGTSLVNSILTVEQEANSKRIRVPNLLFQMIRGGIILALLYYILSGIWQIDLNKIGISVGIASAAIALALQSTLSNLASGLLLLSVKPFRVGEWIEFEGKQGRVVDQNWWSVTLVDADQCKILIPNGLLAQATVNNFGDSPLYKNIEVSFTGIKPPDQVITLLNNLVTGIDTIKSEGSASVSSYGEFSINYDLYYKVLPEDDYVAASQLKQRLYYMACRHGLKINRLRMISPDLEESSQKLLSYLESITYFSVLSSSILEELAGKSKFQIYGHMEWITYEGQQNNYLYIVYQGTVEIKVTDLQGKAQTVDHLTAGETFGEIALYEGEASSITAIAGDNVELITIPTQDILQAIKVNKKFAAEIANLIEVRKRAIRFAKGLVDEEDLIILSN